MKFDPIPVDGELIMITDWVGACKMGAFIDYDGVGHLAYEDQMSDVEVWPSMVQYDEFDKIRQDFTHVVWFNR
jgi:hypothetical protein